MDKIIKGDALTESKNIIEENINILKSIFPEVLVENKIDFQVLKELLGDSVEEKPEHYQFNWAGKSMARKEAHKPSTGTLRPCKEESVNWKNGENIFIEGDNLEVLKLLQKGYSNKVKIIYIDPPYNTGRDFVYKDNYRDNLKNYQEITGQVDREGNRLTTNSESEGRYHSNWLNMMYPRLRLARNLLTNDGLIFISIDNNEYSNLKSICDEIYGEENYKNTVVIKKGAKSVQSQFDTWDKLGSGYEYMLVYSKKSEYRFPKQLKELDAMKSGSWNNHWRGTDRPTMRYEILGVNVDSGQWRWGKDRSIQGIKNYQLFTDEMRTFNFDLSDENIDEFYLKKYGNEKIDLLRLSKNGKPEHYIPPSKYMLLNDVWFDLGISSSGEVTKLFDSKIFDNPKPTKILNQILKFTDDDCIVLDFFAGSCSTADAVLTYNNLNNSNHKFIMVQIPQKTEENSEAFKHGFSTISDISKERIRKVIAREYDEKNDKVGFKVFKLYSSNIKSWDGNPDNLEESLFDSVSNIKNDRTEEDVLYEILLKYGLDLTLPIEEKKIEGVTVFNVGLGAVFICLSDNITNKVAEGIGNWLEVIKMDISNTITDKDLVKKLMDQVSKCRVVFKDTGFTDVEKTNSVQTLKRFGITEIKSI